MKLIRVVPRNSRFVLICRGVEAKIVPIKIVHEKALYARVIELPQCKCGPVWSICTQVRSLLKLPWVCLKEI